MIPLLVERGRGCCCGAPSASPAPPRRWAKFEVARRLVELAGWLIPGTLLALFPKCPLCVAGYVALATGLGMSLTVATYLRWTLLAFCLGSLAFMASRLFARRLRSPASPRG